MSPVRSGALEDELQEERETVKLLRRELTQHKLELHRLRSSSRHLLGASGKVQLPPVASADSARALQQQHHL